MTPHRRRLLRAFAGVLGAGIAGCTDAGTTGEDGDTPEPETDGTTTPTDGETADTAEPTDDVTPTDAGDLDLREANVTGVEFERTDAGYRFSVTLLHDDDGEDGYANWWQVESLDGERLGRRELTHPHGTREFTRSATIEVPEGVDCVVVRGHDQTHEYGGRAVLVSLGSGATRGVRQGSEPAAFDRADCPT